MYFNLEQQHILFSLFYLNLEHGDLKKVWGWCSWGHMNWSQIILYISTRKVQDTLSFWLAYLNLSLTAPWASATSDSFAALISYWTLKHANKLAHKQLFKGVYWEHVVMLTHCICSDGFFCSRRQRPIVPEWLYDGPHVRPFTNFLWRMHCQHCIWELIFDLW